MSRVSAEKNLFIQFKDPTTGHSKVEQQIAKPGSKLSWKERFSRFFYGTLGLHSAYHLFDIGLANFFALDILKHGTSITNYINISLTGSDPKMGGTTEAQYMKWGPNEDWGKGPNLVTFSQNRFFVTHDTAKSPTKTGMHTLNAPTVIPLVYSHMGNSNLTGGNEFLALGLDCFTPLLKFKFVPEHFRRMFKPDTTMPSGCFFTEKAISPIHLGITGSLTQGIGLGMFRRMAQRPGKVLKGAVFLALGGYVAKRTVQYLRSEPTKEAEKTSKFVAKKGLIRRGISSLASITKIGVRMLGARMLAIH